MGTVSKHLSAKGIGLMMKNSLIPIYARGLLLGLVLLGLGLVQAGGTSIGISDLDHLIVTTGSYNALGVVAGDGDSNNDGFSDVGVITYSNSGATTEINLFNGAPGLPLKSNFQTMSQFRITPPAIYSIFKNLISLDLNGDHKDDLVFEASSAVWPPVPSKVFVSFASTFPATPLSLSVVPAELELKINQDPFSSITFEKGDFNGDGVPDLIVGGVSGGHGNVFLLEGRLAFSTHTIVLDDGVSAKRIHSLQDPLFSSRMVTGDMNGDGKTDMIFSGNRSPNGAGRSSAGQIYGIMGSTALPTEWNLDSVPADLTLWGSNTNGNALCPAMGDWNGDGKADVMVIDDVDQKAILLDGSVLATGPHSVDLASGDLGILTTAIGEFVFGIRSPTGDFDGDGKADFFSQSHGILSAFLSNDFSSQAIVPPAAFDFSVPIHWSLGDFNGDGKKDLVVMPEGGPNGSVGIIYGYHPLDNPSILVRGNPSLPKAILDFSVEGDPVEMNLSGDFIETLNGKWVPYQASLPVTFTQTAGEKNLTVVFRNAFGRESPPATKTISLDPGSPRLEVVNNVFVSGGSRVRVDCRLTGPSRVKASVYDQSGEFLAAILDGDLAAGVWPLEWDGANASGRSVVPGIYYMVVEIDGHVQKQKILVQD